MAMLFMHFLSVPPEFCGKIKKIPRKYFINSAANEGKFRGNSTIILHILSMKLHLHTNYLLHLHGSNSVVFSHFMMRVIVFSKIIFVPKDDNISAN